MQEILEKIVHGDFHDPFQVLGVHWHDCDMSTAHVRTFQPHAERVDLLLEGSEYAMTKVHDHGLFETVVSKEKLNDTDFFPYNYRYRITFYDGAQSIINDPYRFLPQLNKDDAYLFNYGTNYKLYNHLGSHKKTIQHVSGIMFRVWAPSAKRISVVGNFNGWDGRVHPLRSLDSSGIWELFIPGLLEGELYKFEIKTQENHIFLKSDPFQFYGETRPKNRIYH